MEGNELREIQMTQKGHRQSMEGRKGSEGSAKMTESEKNGITEKKGEGKLLCRKNWKRITEREKSGWKGLGR